MQDARRSARGQEISPWSRGLPCHLVTNEICKGSPLAWHAKPGDVRVNKEKRGYREEQPLVPSKIQEDLHSIVIMTFWEYL